MQFDSIAQVWVICAASKLIKCIVFEGIEAAKCPKPLWKQGSLSAYPVILFFNLRVLVRRFVSGLSISKRSGQEDSTLYTGCVQKPDDISSSDRLYTLELRHRRAEQMLMVVRLGSDLFRPGIRLGRLTVLSDSGGRSQKEQRKNLKTYKQSFYH